MEFFIQFFVAAIATVTFAVLFSAPKNELLFCGFSGGFAWLIYYVMMQADYGAVISSGVATFLLTVFARLFAVMRKHPVTIYLLTGIFPLVPGAGIFYTAYHLFHSDMVMSSAKGVETFEISGAIVIGIIFGFAIPQSIFSKLGKLRRQS